MPLRAAAWRRHAMLMARAVRPMPRRHEQESVRRRPPPLMSMPLILRSRQTRRVLMRAPHDAPIKHASHGAGVQRCGVQRKRGVQ